LFVFKSKKLSPLNCDKTFFLLALIVLSGDKNFSCVTGSKTSDAIKFRIVVLKIMSFIFLSSFDDIGLKDCCLINTLLS